MTVSTKLKSPSPRVSILLAANNNANDELERRIQSFLGDDESVERVVVRGSDTDDIDGAIWEDLETGKPPEIMVMKEVRGRLSVVKLADECLKLKGILTSQERVVNRCHNIMNESLTGLLYQCLLPSFPSLRA